jgi:hypothetical protein
MSVIRIFQTHPTNHGRWTVHVTWFLLWIVLMAVMEFVLFLFSLRHVQYVVGEVLRGRREDLDGVQDLFSSGPTVCVIKPQHICGV